MHVEIHALIGPTASGKEAVALALAPDLGAEILSLDSMKLYRRMEVGTAKASRSHRERIPHHLLDLADPDEVFSTRRWLTAADAALADVRARGRFPLLVGGTALYLKALLYGLFEGPDADPALRALLKAQEPRERHRRLAEADPESAKKIHVNDTRRVVRALEIFHLTGRPASDLRRQWREGAPRRSARLIGIRRDRHDLYRRIDARVEGMLSAGLVDEVRALLPDLGPTARQALGYREIADFLEGRLPDLAEVIQIIKNRTRAFARRQLTWFKHFDVFWVDTTPDESTEDLAARVRPLLSPPQE